LDLKKAYPEFSIGLSIFRWVLRVKYEYKFDARVGKDDCLERCSFYYRKNSKSSIGTLVF